MFSLWRPPTFAHRSSGLGLATVESLLSANAYVAVLDLRPPPTPRIAESSSKLKFFQTDITKVEDIEKAVDGTVKWAKETGARLGGVVNCAGVGTAAKVRRCSRFLRNNTL